MNITTKFDLLDRPFTMLNNKVKQVTVRTICVRVTPCSRIVKNTETDIRYVIEWDSNTKADYSEGGPYPGLSLPKELPEKLLFPSKAELLQSL